MHRISPRGRWSGLCALALAWGTLPALAAEPAPTLSLSQAFERAWARQPEAQALPERRASSQAQRDASRAWTPEPVAVEASVRSDRWHRREGAQELEVGVAVPLWLPGERERAQGLAEAQLQAVDARALLAQWQLARALRERWWALQRDREDLRAAQERLQASQALAADVARRVQAGDLSRADQHQAAAARAQAQAEQALAQAQAVASEHALRALLSLAPGEPLQPADAPEPEPAPDAAAPAHPLLQALAAQAAAAQRAEVLAAAQSRPNPELTLLQGRDRSARGEPSAGSVTLGLRWPLGRSERHRATLSAAAAERTELEAQLARERERVDAERHSAAAALMAARAVLAAATERARLATETRAFFDKSFRLGETDLPTRLRVDQEAAHAQRELARARIDLNRAIAQQRQSLGLLPQ